MTKLVAGLPDEGALLPAGGELLKRLVADDGWLPDTFSAADPNRYCQYLLHCDPLERFSVVSFVWGPGQCTPVHDHQVWGAIGVLRGVEEATSFTRDPKSGLLIEGPTQRLEPGQVDFVSPRIGDIHQVRNVSKDRASVSIHVYGANIGAVQRNVFDPDTGEPSEFVSGYTLESVPNLWGRSSGR